MPQEHTGRDEDEGDDDDCPILGLVHDPAAHLVSLQNLPMPVPLGPDEHLIQVHAVALTNGELGWLGPAAAVPPIPGYEMSGTVALAPRTSPFQPGTEVYACTAFARQGNAREFTIALTEELGQRPENLSWEEAATVPMSALTAWQALFVHGGLSLPSSPRPAASAAAERPQPRQQTPLSMATTAPSSRPPPVSTRHRLQRSRSIARDDANANKRVLITAAAGGVGLWAVQLARLAGVGHITATCGQGNVGFVRSLGAHRVVDYSTTRNNSTGSAGATTATGTGSGPGATQSRPRSSSRTSSGHSNSSDKYDLVLDCVGGEVLRHAWTRARHGGTVISVAAPAEQFKPESGVGMDVRSAWFIVEANSQQLQAITDLIEAEMARAAFDSAFHLDQHEAAFGRAYSRHLRGKVVLRLA